MQKKRPRVAAIGLDETHINSIAGLCGDLRTASSVYEYLEKNSWTETDVAVIRDQALEIAGEGAHFLTIGLNELGWWHPEPDVPEEEWECTAFVSGDNTEWELSVSTDCPEVYYTLASDLRKHLAAASDPPSVQPIIADPTEHLNQHPDLGTLDVSPLIQTTSGYPVAARYLLTNRKSAEQDASSVVLALPTVSNLSDWLEAFLRDINKTYPDQVPHPPPNVGNPSEWYILEERLVAKQIQKITNEIGSLERKIEHLDVEREQLETQLALEGERAKAGIKGALWADGKNLVAKTTQLLTDLGFKVQDMDTKPNKGEAKREDLRITLDDHQDWEAIAEIKGYNSGTKTNDSRQIREQRDRYMEEKKGQAPSLTLWIANPYRSADPSLRPPPDKNVSAAAKIIGAVHVLVPDLYKQWLLVKSGRTRASDVVRHLISAEPGCWSPIVAGSDNTSGSVSASRQGNAEDSVQNA